MNKTKPNTQEKGITLLALAITIIVLVILAAVTINGLTGEEGILTSTTTATKNYTIAEYKEKLEESTQQTIIEKAVLGEEATLDSLKENIASTDTSLQTITMGDSINDVIVKTEEGYLFQVYFDELLSEYHVEYMGNADTSYIPKITYTENAGVIEINATSGNISKISISLNGAELNSTDTNQLTYTANTSGTYIVTIETTEGLTRYAYINVTFANDNIYAPTITAVAIDSSEATNGWYKTSVYLTIDGTSTNGTTMKYKLIGATTQEETPITDLTSATVLTISNTGLTKAIAWVEYEENGTTYKSDYSYYDIKIDSIAPDTPTITNVTGTEGNEATTNIYWYTTDVEVEITSEDANSGIYGYTYSITGTTNVSETTVIGKTQKISFETDGKYALTIYSIDKAGNKSTTPYTLTVYKDSTAPEIFVPSIVSSTTSSITIGANATDEASGIAYYEYVITLGGTEIARETTTDSTETTKEITDLSSDNTYGVYVIAYDNAGNYKTSVTISVTPGTTTSSGSSSGGSSSGDSGGSSSTTAPTITVTDGTPGTNGWYKSTVTVKISSTSSNYATSIQYEVDGANLVAAKTETGTSISFDIIAEGISYITAYSVNGTGSLSDAATATIKIDTEGPSISGVESNGTSETTATISVVASDSNSGVASYQYYYGDTLKALTTTTSTTDAGTVTGLTTGNTNECSVIVTDQAGNTSTSFINVETKLYKWNYYSVTVTYTATTDPDDAVKGNVIVGYKDDDKNRYFYALTGTSWIESTETTWPILLNTSMVGGRNDYFYSGYYYASCWNVWPGCNTWAVTCCITNALYGNALEVNNGFGLVYITFSCSTRLDVEYAELNRSGRTTTPSAGIIM